MDHRDLGDVMFWITDTSMLWIMEHLGDVMVWVTLQEALNPSKMLQLSLRSVSWPIRGENLHPTYEGPGTSEGSAHS